MAELQTWKNLSSTMPQDNFQTGIQNFHFVVCFDFSTTRETICNVYVNSSTTKKHAKLLNLF